MNVGNGLDRSAYTVTAGSKPESRAPGAALPAAVNFTAPQAERSRAFPTKYNAPLPHRFKSQVFSILNSQFLRSKKP